MKRGIIVSLLLVTAVMVFAQKFNHGGGTFVISGTGSYDDSLALSTFVRLLPDGANSTVLFIPTASSGLKLPNGYIYIPPRRDTTESYTRDFETELEKIFKVNRVKILHTRDRSVANSETFVRGIKNVNAVWISGGNAGRLADAYLNTKTQSELAKLIERGGVIGGNSAGAIILGSYIVRGWTEKPILMAKGHDKGFDFIKGVAFNPHLLTAKREYELMSVVHEYPELLGIGIDDYGLL
ncbi:MAG TPA: Type 1 glutamine amidotransferase-like domain-containing protein, partial [Cyclobacteriaceae bacterium]|nr:Type 1 glutamine amidotransferase-like domain-containing protein [Cyclobacteriaceae bacterium]